MRKLPLIGGGFAQVDDADYEWLSRFKWYPCATRNNTYATRNVTLLGKHTTAKMHRDILGITDKRLLVDHIDHDGLNNQRANLRPCTHSQNNMNRRINKNNNSGIKGAYWHSSNGAWSAQIRLNGKAIHLGMFTTKEAAGEAYAVAADKHFSEFALPARAEK